jgi:two-component system CheB/CheR fusion protein
LKAAFARRPDALLLDIGLPGMDGFEVAKQIRSYEQFKKVLIIALSAYSRESFLDRSWQACIDHYLVKPAEFGIIRTLLEQLRESAKSPAVDFDRA